MQDLLKTPAATQSQNLMNHEFRQEKLVSQIDIENKSIKQNSDIDDTPSSFNNSLYAYFMKQQDQDEHYLEPRRRFSM